MQQLNSTAARATPVQKGIALILLLGVIWGLVKVITPFFADLVELFKNVWLAVILGTPLVLAFLYIISNPLVIWGFFKTLSVKMTAFLIKMDPLSVMDRYVDILRHKLGNLKETVNILQGKKVKLDRRVYELQKNVEANIKLGAAAHKQGKTQQASMFGIKVQTDKNTITMLMPLQGRIDRNLTFLKSLEENWEFGIEKLEYQIDAKRQEYEIIRETTRGLKNAEDFINSDNEAARLYGMSLKALEESVTQQIGYMDEFERRSKGIMDSITIEKQAVQDEGLAELEKYITDGSLRMPDYTQFNPQYPIQDIAYETVPAQTQTKFNLLKNK